MQQINQNLENKQTEVRNALDVEKSSIPMVGTPLGPEDCSAGPKRQVFVNDLTPEERERAVAEYAERIREQLSSETISVNCMSRLLNMAHPKVSALLSVTNSAKEALLDTSTNKVVRAKSLLQKLSDEQRKLLIEQLKSETDG